MGEGGGQCVHVADHIPLLFARVSGKKFGLGSADIPLHVGIIPASPVCIVDEGTRSYLVPTVPSGRARQHLQRETRSLKLPPECPTMPAAGVIFPSSFFLVSFLFFRGSQRKQAHTHSKHHAHRQISTRFR